MDRLLGNSHLYDKGLAVYRWYAQQIISNNSMPIVLVDWIGSQISSYPTLSDIRKRAVKR
jgi:hypothetical protein